MKHLINIYELRSVKTPVKNEKPVNICDLQVGNTVYYWTNDSNPAFLTPKEYTVINISQARTGQSIIEFVVKGSEDNYEKDTLTKYAKWYFFPSNAKCTTFYKLKSSYSMYNENIPIPENPKITKMFTTDADTFYKYSKYHTR